MSVEDPVLQQSETHHVRHILHNDSYLGFSFNILCYHSQPPCCSDETNHDRDDSDHITITSPSSSTHKHKVTFNLPSTHSLPPICLPVSSFTRLFLFLFLFLSVSFPLPFLLVLLLSAPHRFLIRVTHLVHFTVLVIFRPVSGYHRYH